VTFNSVDQEITAVAGDALPGTDPAVFAEALAAFKTVEGLDDGPRPDLQRDSLRSMPYPGARSAVPASRSSAGSGRFDNGRFNSLANKGGSLRQPVHRRCVHRLEGASAATRRSRVEPPEATVHNVGRLTTPLFGAGLIDRDSRTPSSSPTRNAQPTSVRGIVNRVKILLPKRDG